MSALVSWQWQWAKMVWRPCLMIRWSSQRPKRFQGHGELQGKTLFVLVNFLLAGICISVVLNYRALFWWLPGGNNGSLFLRSNKLWEIFQLQLKSQNARRARLRSGPQKVRGLWPKYTQWHWIRPEYTWWLAPVGCESGQIRGLHKILLLLVSYLLSRPHRGFEQPFRCLMIGLTCICYQALEWHYPNLANWTTLAQAKERPAHLWGVHWVCRAHWVASQEPSEEC